MRPHRFLAIAALALASGAACAYEIIESRYRVEIAPGQFQDQLVLKCDNGRQVTVPWEAKLYEACGEDLMGRPIKNASPDEGAQDRQKEVMMSRVREQYGNIDERYVQFQSGPAGVSMQFQGPIRDVLKRYEICRKQTKNSPTCVSERDQALAALKEKAGAAPVAQNPLPAEPQARAMPEARPAAEPKPVAEAKPAAKPRKVAKARPAPPPAVMAEPAGDEGGVPVQQVTEVAPPQTRGKPVPMAVAPIVEAPADEAPAAAPIVAAAPAATAAPPATAPAAAAPSEVQSTPEQKIAEDYTWCMRAKPKFECEQARAKALSALNKSKAKQVKPAPGKPKSVNGTGPIKAAYAESAR
jgi:hypothetical protein